MADGDVILECRGWDVSDDRFEGLRGSVCWFFEILRIAFATESLISLAIKL